VSLLDYYRQFEDIDESEYNRLLRERRAREKALALEHVPPLDLSSNEWPEFPNVEVVQASVYAARGRVNGYPDSHATVLRRALAERHNIKSSQIVIGNGAGELLQTAAHLLVARDNELVMPWPSYPLYPTIALRAGGRPVPVDLVDGRADPGALLDAVTERTRVIFICNPNDPTGAYLESDTIGELMSRVPDRVHVLLDEAFIQFQDVEEEDAALKLVEAFPRLLVFRTFSKIYGLSGLRAGYVVGSPAASELLGGLSPVLGVNALTQAAVAQTLRVGGAEVARRRTMVIEQRARLGQALRELPVKTYDSQANFLWLRADGLGGAELAARLEKARVRVAAGGPLGDDDHIRAAIRDGTATDRLLGALRQALGILQGRGHERAASEAD
jgi:histidinol-phosphate aminotransferase